MARGSKINFNRAKVDAAVLAIADGALEWAKTAVTEAGRDAPDSPYMPWPTGEGLPKQGGAMAYFDGKKIGQFSLDGKTPKPPRAARVSRSRGLVLILGWGFPARFNEFGTVRTRAQPFVARSFDAAMAEFEVVAAPVVKAKLGSQP